MVADLIGFHVKLHTWPKNPSVNSSAHINLDHVDFDFEMEEKNYPHKGP